MGRGHQEHSVSVARSVPLGVIMLVLVGLAVAGHFAFREEQPLLQPDNRQVVDAGEQIYRQQCASCHGDNLEGQANWKSPDVNGFLPAPPHDETGHTWHHADTVLIDLTKFGIGRMTGNDDYKTTMPVYEDVLSDDAIVAVLSFIKSTWPADIRQRHDKLNAHARGR